MKFKGLIASTVILGSILLPSNSFADGDKPITVFVDGQQLSFEVAPVIQDGSTLVPIRAVFEKLGLTVSWDESTKTITGTKNGLNIQMQIGNTNAVVNGKVITLEVPPNIINGSTLVPLRFVGEASGNDIAWDGANRRIDVKSMSSKSVYITNVTNSDSGATYSGYFKDNKPNGEGTLTTPQGDKYVGNFKDGAFEGYGVLQYKNGSKYEGNWMNGKWNGNGKLTFKDGSGYQGDFKDGAVTGYGSEFDSDGKVTRSGMYSNGKFVSATSTTSTNGTSGTASNKIDMINQEYLRHTQALQTLENDHNKTINFIEDKITSIRRSSSVGYYSDSEYTTKLTKLQSDRQLKQNRLNALSLDNSPEGKSKARQLTQEIADFDQQIKSLQEGRSAQVQIQALEDQEKQENRSYQDKVQAENALYQSNLAGIR